MSTRRGKQVVSKAIEILKNSSEGIRFSQLVDKVRESLPDVEINTIRFNVSKLDATSPDHVYKPSWGIYRHVSFKEKDVTSPQLAPTPSPAKTDEVDFYQPFSTYLTNDLEECTKAIPLGGNRFKDKWGTPDVIGIKKAMASDIIKSEGIIVSAEIKTDTSGLIYAFGQACAYKLFSHKVYIAIPKNANEEDKSRIESLCLIFGIGLILFDSEKKDSPRFEIRVRPLKHEPDMFYVNKYMKMVEEELFS